MIIRRGFWVGEVMMCGALVFATACGSPGDEGGESVPEGGMGTCEDPDLVEVPGLRLRSCVDGMEHDLVYIDAAAGSELGLVVTQRQLHEVRVFDREGLTVARMGFRGSGPGAFRNVIRVGWVGDTIWAYDSDVRRLSRFLSDGELVATSPVPTAVVPGGGEGGRLPFEPLAVARTRLVVAEIFNRDLWSSHPLVGDNRVFASIRGDQVVSVLAELPPLERVRMRTLGGAVRSVSVTPPLPADVVWGVAPDGSRFVQVDGREPDRPVLPVLVLDLRGDTVLRLEVPHEPVPVPGDFRRRALARMEERAREAETELAASAWREAAYVPEFVPPVRDVTVGPRGTIVIHGVAHGQGELILRAGYAPTRIVLPEYARVIACLKDELWVAARDELGVESVLLYELTTVPGAAPGGQPSDF